MMTTILQYFVGLFAAYPALCAGVVGTMLSQAATQFLKGFIPDEMPDQKHRAWVRIIGFFTGWILGYGAWRLIDPTTGAFGDFYYSMGVGLMSPFLYSLAVPFAVKRYPFLEDVLSGRPKSGSAKPV